MQCAIGVPYRRAVLSCQLVAVCGVVAVLGVLAVPVLQWERTSLSAPAATSATSATSATPTTSTPSRSLAAAIAGIETRYHPSYAITPTRTGFATRLAPGMPAAIGRDGAVRITDVGAGVDFSLSPVGVGRQAMTALVAGPATAAGSGVVQSLGALTAQYANSPRGLQQSFVVAQRPVGTAPTFAVELRPAPGVSAEAPGGRAVEFFSHGTPIVSYGGLSVTDATGAPVPASFAVSRGIVRIVVDDRGARYPLRIDPTYTSEGGISPGGFSVAISGNGKIALVGDPWNENPQGGEVFLLAQSSSGWSSTTVGVPSPEPDNPGYWQDDTTAFGYAVALSSDGKVAAVTAPGAFGGLGGAAMVYDVKVPKSGIPSATWAGYVTPSTPNPVYAVGQFGDSVVVWHDTPTATTEVFVGAPGSYGLDPGAGAVFEFTDPTLTTYPNGNYAPDPYAVALYDGTDSGIRAPGGAHLGTSLALAPDHAVFAGGPDWGEETAAERPDAGMVVSWDWGDWPENAQPTTVTSYGVSCGCSIVGRRSGDLLGTSVAVSANGQVVAAGEPGAIPDGSAVASGAVTIAHLDEVGTQIGPQTGAVAGEGFGASVAMSKDGKTVLVGAPVTACTEGEGGTGVTPYAYVESAGSSWATHTEQALPGITGQAYGHAVALDGDATDALVGAPDVDCSDVSGGSTSALLEDLG